MNAVDEYNDDYYDDSDQEDEFDEDVRPSSYAIKAFHPKINNSSCYVLVDTGASRSIVATKLAKAWGCKIEPHGGPRFKAANNSSVHISGVTVVPLVLGKKIVKIKIREAAK